MACSSRFVCFVPSITYVDAFGAGDDFLPDTSPFKTTYASYAGKGLSLSRRSATWESNKEYNWRAAFASPGAANFDTSLVPYIVRHYFLFRYNNMFSCKRR